MRSLDLPCHGRPGLYPTHLVGVSWRAREEPFTPSSFMIMAIPVDEKPSDPAAHVQHLGHSWLTARNRPAHTAGTDRRALVAALVDDGTDDGRADLLARRKMSALEQRFQQRERELARALIQIAALTVAIQIREAG